MLNKMKGHNMINKTKWSSYTSDDHAKWCIDCGDSIHNDWVAECNADWQEYKATCEEEKQ